MPLFKKNVIFVIAEMANSHEGNLKKAKQITSAAAKAGADAIKFQKFKAIELVEKTHKNFSLYKKLEMSQDEWKELINFAKKQKLKVLIDVDGIKSAKEISKFNIDGYKIHATDTLNPFLLDFLSNQKRPILVSTAGSFPNEIEETLKNLKKNDKEICLMHSYQAYPTKIEDLNLSKIMKLKNKFDLPIGIMDHVAGDSNLSSIVPLLAICCGASIIEKHIALNRSEKKYDYFSALNPDEFTNLTKLIKKTKSMLGKGMYELSEQEKKYRKDHKKKTIAKKEIKRGTKLNDKLFDFKLLENKKESVSFYDYREKILSKNILKNAVLTPKYIKNSEKKVACVLACRIDSSRLFGKPLQLLGNYTILELLVKQIQKSKVISDIVLAISEKKGNEIFIELARKLGIKFVFGNEKDVLKRLIDGAKYVDAKIIFRVTPENPFIYWEGIDNAITKHIQGNFDYSIITPLPLGSGFQIINRQALELSHTKGKSRHRSEHADLYITENKTKFKINVIRPPKQLQRKDFRLTVDTPQDLILVRWIHKTIGKENEAISLKSVVELLDKNHRWAEINKGIKMTRMYGLGF